MEFSSVEERLLKLELTLGQNTKAVAAQSETNERLYTLIRGRPSWTVATIISMQHAAIAVLITLLLSK